MLKKFTDSVLVGNQTQSETYYLMRRIFAAGLGLVYLNAFLIYFFQGLGLYGEKGLLPYQKLIPAVQNSYGSNWEAFTQFLSLFVFSYSDTTIQIVGVVGILLALPLIFGYANFPLLLLLWFIHMSIIHAGQIFYSYGWETQLLELTFLSVFLFPLLDPRLDQAKSPPKRISILFIRWMMFRLMFGAGMIKIRGDRCWLDLTCTQYHYETQPNPHPFSWFLHQLPDWIHAMEVVLNHAVELILPIALFGPKWIRRICGVGMIGFQVSLIISGNLAWLNWITLLMAIPCFDDEFLTRLGRIKHLRKYLNIKSGPVSNATLATLSLFLLVGVYYSIDPALNLVSNRQLMNTSYSRLHLINSYGAFGSIGKTRNEIIIKGTQDQVVTAKTQWKEYEFKCKPGDPLKRPCLITPYHYRLDWQIWFSAMRNQLDELWLLRLGIGMLENNQNILGLIDTNPFPDKPPKFIQMDLYRYELTDFGDPHWWNRSYLAPYSTRLSLDHPLVRKHR